MRGNLALALLLLELALRWGKGYGDFVRYKDRAPLAPIVHLIHWLLKVPTQILIAGTATSIHRHRN